MKEKMIAPRIQQQIQAELDRIEGGFGVVPTEFGVLVERLVDNPSLRQAIDGLLACKMAGHELDQGPRIPVISDFVAGELSRLAPESQPQPHTKDPATLDALLVDMLIERYGSPIGQQSEVKSADRNVRPTLMSALEGTFLPEFS